MQRCWCEVQRLCPGMFDGINPNTPYRWTRSAQRAAPLCRKSLSPADKTHLSEHIMRVTDVLAQRGHDQRLGARMARRRGTRRASRQDLGQAALARRALELQEARQGSAAMSSSTPTRTSCSSSCAAASCLYVRSSGTAAASSKLSCTASRHSQSLTAWTVARWTVGADRARGQDRHRLAGAAWNGWATTTTLL